MNQGPAYFGDLDEADGKLLEYERQAEEEGTSMSMSSQSHFNFAFYRMERRIYKYPRNP